jgi:hypothetical protein
MSPVRDPPSEMVKDVDDEGALLALFLLHLARALDAEASLHLRLHHAAPEKLTPDPTLDLDLVLLLVEAGAFPRDPALVPVPLPNLSQEQEQHRKKEDEKEDEEEVSPAHQPRLQNAPPLDTHQRVDLPLRQREHWLCVTIEEAMRTAVEGVGMEEGGTELETTIEIDPWMG